jgi:putative membrane protein
MSPGQPARDHVRLADAQSAADLEHDRTHLAAERTYAAWLRTGLSIAAGGIAIVRLLPEPEEHSHLVLAIGGSFVLLGVGIITYGARQFTRTARRLREGGRPEPTTPRAAWAITVGLALLLVAVMVFLAMNPPGSPGNDEPAPGTATSG